MAFQLGKIYIELNDLNKAAEAFNSVMEYEPTIKTEFQSKLELAKTKLKLDDYNSSLEILNELKTEDKFRQYSDVIIYQLGVTYLSENKFEDAVENFLAVDTMKVLSEKETAGLARIKLGELWEYDYMQYDSAAKYYSKAASSFLTPDEKSYSISKLTLFRNYKQLSKDIYRYGRQLAYINDPQEFVKDSIDYADYLYELRQDSLENSTNNNQTDTQANARDRSRASNQTGGNTQIEEKRIKPVRPILSSDTLTTILAKDKYDLGNMFFIELNVPDSAYYYYKDVLDNYPPRSFTPNVIFALGSYYLTENDTAKADSIFQHIYDEYQGLPVADQAARRLGISEFNAETDSSAMFYLDAEQKLLDENYDGAIQNFYALAEKFPESVLAPKALYSVGWILENELKNLDSAAVVFDTLYNRYEKSLYAKDIASQLNEYKREKLQQQMEDSVQVKAKALSDSTQVKEKMSNRPKKILKEDEPNNPNRADSLKSEPKNREALPLKDEKERLELDSATSKKEAIIEGEKVINEKPGEELLKEGKTSGSTETDSLKALEKNRKALLLKEEKESMEVDSTRRKPKLKILEELEDKPDSTNTPDSGKTIIKPLLK